MINRLLRLFQADFHAVLDQLEEPQALLKQSLREMEAHVGGLEQQLEQRRQEQQRLRKQIDKCQQFIADVEPQLNLCFESGDENLARNLVRRRLEWQRQLQQLQEQLQLSETQAAELDNQLQNCRQRYQAIKQKADLFIDDSVDGTARYCSTDHGGSTSITEDELQVAWLAELAKRKDAVGKTGGKSHG